jgi:outer membrane receptor for ferrienterochelin and colicin
MQTFEINYLGVIGDYASISLSVFRNQADKLISRTNAFINGETKLHNTNSGKLRTYGSELSIHFKPTSNWNAKVSATYQHSKNLQAGYENIELGYSPELLAYLSVSYKFLKNATFCISGYYVDNMLTNWTPDITGIEYGHRIGNEIPGYFIINGNLRFNRIFNEKIFLSAYVFNILNQDIRYPATTVNDGFDKGTFGYSRYFNLSLGYNF